MAQTQLTFARVIMHIVAFIFLAGYMLYQKVPLVQGMFMFAVCVFYWLIYLSYVIVNNMKPKTPKFKLVGKRVVITGGSSGIGFELAKLCVEAECSKVVIIARNEGRLKAKVAELKEMLSTDDQVISCLSLDLSSDGAEIANRMKRLGGVDLLVNCAGYSVPGEFENLDTNVFEDMIKANYLSAVHTTHAIVPSMIEKKQGQIVFLSSVGGQLGIYGFTGYSGSKYAIRGFAEVLYHELRPYDIGVSLAFPPDTKTPGFDKEMEQKPKLCQAISEQAGLWEVEDVAKIIKDGIVKRKFMIGFGSDGYFMNALSAGASPANSVLEFWVHSFLGPILRVYMLFLQNMWTNMIDNELKTN
eukprot:TCONS_00023432-protein